MQNTNLQNTWIKKKNIIHKDIRDVLSQPINDVRIMPNIYY